MQRTSKQRPYPQKAYIIQLKRKRNKCVENLAHSCELGLGQVYTANILEAGIQKSQTGLNNGDTSAGIAVGADTTQPYSVALPAMMIIHLAHWALGL